MPPLQVYWARCVSGVERVWCQLRTVDAESVNSRGVYIIWHGGQTPRVVNVGRGDIASRISHYRTSSRMLQYESEGMLMVTWARIAEADRRGVEKFLASQLNPIRGDDEDPIAPIPVNLPWPEPPSTPDQAVATS